MSQNIELNKVKARIKALANKTIERGCTEHEANEAMVAVGRLLAQYNLTMNEIDVRESVCKTIAFKAGRGRGTIDMIVVSLASVFDAKIWRSSRYVDVPDGKRKKNHRNFKKEYTYKFFGTEDDLAMIEYLYRTIEQAIHTETDLFKLSSTYEYARSKKSATTSFGHGMASRINVRLAQLKTAMENELVNAENAIREDIKAGRVEASATGTALVALKGVLVRSEFEKIGLKLKNAYGERRTSDDRAYDSGKKAGDRVNLNRPITGGSKTSGYGRGDPTISVRTHKYALTHQEVEKRNDG